ncbi:MAG: GDP-mannose 4,6-dehydratase [Desulfobacterales bacterium]|nr:GDP-mannose 4,6-dehydratase [Desulfobacterales bacterium]
MKILITGGAGFIGSHLADRLIETGHEIYIVDNLSSGSMDNVKHHQNNDKFHLIVDTILNQELMENIVRQCDQVYHLAAAVGVKLIMNRPVETLETNVRGTEMILKMANKYKKKVFITSTSEVYGKIMNGKNSPLLLEDTDRLMGSTTKRRWAYACSKAFDEFLALAYYEEKKLPVVIARLFNTVGPRQTGQYGMVLPNFVQKALIGKPIIVYGNGSQSRSFLHIADAVEAMICLMNESNAEGEVVNIGNTEEIMIKDLAFMVREMAESSSEIEYISYERAYGPGYEDMLRRTPDISKLKRLAGFEPRHKIDEIVRSVIDYYKI